MKGCKRKERRFSVPILLRLAVLQFQMQAILGGWVDPDTPKEALKTKPLAKEDNRSYQLVSLLSKRIRFLPWRDVTSQLAVP
jgi:hypothetical protein